MTRNDVPNWRMKSSRMSTIGSRRVSSHGIRMSNETAEITAKVVMKLEANQSLRWPSSRKTSRHPSASTTRMKPAQSTLRPPFSLSRRSRSRTSGSTTSHCTSASERMPKGTLMKNIQCQEKLSVSHPPIVGPTVGATMTAMP